MFRWAAPSGALLQRGVPSDAEPGLAVRVFLGNVVCLVLTGIVFLFTWFFFAAGLPGPAWTSLASVAIGSACFWLNQRGHHLMARVGVICLANIMGFLLASFLGPETRFDQGFFVMVGVPALLLEPRQWRLIALGALLPIVFYALAECHITPLVAPIALSPARQALVHSVSATLYALGIFLQVLCFAIAYQMSMSRERETQQELFQSRRLAEMGQMAGGVAHEINNPLAVIKLCSDVLKEASESGRLTTEAVLEAAANIDAMVVRIHGIVDGLLTFSSGGERVPPRLTKLADLVAHALELSRERFRARGIGLQVSPIADSLIIECRPAQILQVMLSLMSNACDAVEALPERWVRIEAADGGNEIELAVVDSGHGISRDVADRIFNPFFTTKPVGKGTGLGLSVSASLVGAHRGRLFLDAASPNTRFVCRLPKAEAA